jgi:YkoP-like protein
MAVWDSARRGRRPARSRSRPAEVLFAFDAWQRRRQGVFEYTSDSDCIFRLDICRARRPFVLIDGTRVSPGDRMARLHYWNEQIPPMPKDGPTIGWARRMQRAIAASLRRLAHYLTTRPDLDDIVVVCADVPSATRTQSAQLARIMARYGFETIAEPDDVALGERLHRFGENILISLIVLTRNTSALRADTLTRARVPIYLSRLKLEKDFAVGRSLERELS